MFTYLRIITVINFFDIVDKEQTNETIVWLNNLGGGRMKKQRR